MGITDYAQQQLGEIVFSEVSAEVGSQVEAGEAFGEVESVKSSSELLSPLSGTISEINSLVVENPKILNQAPEGEGWIVKMENFDVSHVIPFFLIFHSLYIILGGKW